MRVLAAIPHYFAARPDEDGDGRSHGSTGRDPSSRVEALSENIAALLSLFDPSQAIIDIGRRTTVPANAPLAARVDVIVCTTGDAHLIPRLDLDAGAFEHRETGVRPLALGFACRAVLRERIGMYDYYCYLEDDLILRDPWFFAKLSWFNGHLGDDRVLQPNRYERSRKGFVKKVYVDGDLADSVILPFGDPDADPALRSKFLGREVAFRRPRNPHSGCYFLSASQFASWAARGDFLDLDASFIGPLESAATLGLLRAFAVYKPVRENAAFLEIEHHGTGFLGQIRLR